MVTLTAPAAPSTCQEENSFWVHLSKDGYLRRGAWAVLSIVELHPSLGRPASLFKSVHSCIHAGNALVGAPDVKRFVHVVVVTASLAAKVFQVRTVSTAVGVYFTLKNSVNEMGRIRHAHDFGTVVKSGIKLSGNALYLGCLATGRAELWLAGSAVRIVTRCIKSKDEVDKDHWIEAGAELFVAGYRFQELIPKIARAMNLPS